MSFEFGSCMFIVPCPCVKAPLKCPPMIVVCVEAVAPFEMLSVAFAEEA